jgi:hypothetical protein
VAYRVDRVKRGKPDASSIIFLNQRRYTSTRITIKEKNKSFLEFSFVGGTKYSWGVGKVGERKNSKHTEK